MKVIGSLLLCFSQEGRDDLKKRPKPAPRFISIQDVKYVLVALVVQEECLLYVVLHCVVMHSLLFSTFLFSLNRLTGTVCQNPA